MRAPSSHTHTMLKKDAWILPFQNAAVMAVLKGFVDAKVEFLGFDTTNIQEFGDIIIHCGTYKSKDFSGTWVDFFRAICIVLWCAKNIRTRA